MGLLRKRWAQRVADATAAARGRIREATGADIALQVDEASFPEDAEVMEDFFVHDIYGLSAIGKALEMVGRDALGKEAIQEQVQSIVVHNTAQRFADKGSKSVSLEDGTLTVSCAFSEGSDNLYRPDELAKAIEQLL